MEEDRCVGRRKGMRSRAVDRLAVGLRVKGVEVRLADGDLMVAYLSAV